MHSSTWNIFVFKNIKPLYLLLNFEVHTDPCTQMQGYKPTMGYVLCSSTSCIFEIFKNIFTLNIQLITLNYNALQCSRLDFFHFRNFSSQFQDHKATICYLLRFGTTCFIFYTLNSSPTLTILSFLPPGANPQFWAILWSPCFHLHWTSYV